MTISTVVEENPRGFGRIVRDADGKVSRIVEEKGRFSRRIEDYRNLIPILTALMRTGSGNHWTRSKNPRWGEYYLTDLVEIAYKEGKLVEAREIKDKEEAIGINNRVHLAEATRVMQQRINREMDAGRRHHD